jgi:broad specificity phosphatase PhoE
MPITLVYETHSTTLDNEAGIATGWLPGKLSEDGLRQASALGERRRDDAIDLALTSDLARAVETTRVALGDSGIPVREDPRLRECNYGDLNGSPVGQLTPRAAYIWSPFPGGESYEDVVQRTADLLEDLAATVADECRVLLVSHSANRWALAFLLDGLALELQVDAPFGWREGWEYSLPIGWVR